MMGFLAAAFFAAIAVALYVARAPLARGQALIFGGRMGPGIVIAEAIVFVVLAVLALLFRDLFG